MYHRVLHTHLAALAIMIIISTIINKCNISSCSDGDSIVVAVVILVFIIAVANVTVINGISDNNVAISDDDVTISDNNVIISDNDVAISDNNVTISNDDVTISDNNVTICFHVSIIVLLHTLYMHDVGAIHLTMQHLILIIHNITCCFNEICHHSERLAVVAKNMSSFKKY